MTTTTDAGKYPGDVHQGNNIKTFREFRGMKQDAFGAAIGNLNQQQVSQLEKQRVIESENLLEKAAEVLNVPVELLKNFKEGEAKNYSFNNFNDNSFHQGVFNVNHYQFNPIEKLVEVYAEMKDLYERLLKAEKEKVEMIEQISKRK